MLTKRIKNPKKLRTETSIRKKKNSQQKKMYRKRTTKSN